MIFKDRGTGYYTIISDKVDKAGNPYIVGVELGLHKDWKHVNRITSLYGRENAFESFIAKNG